MEIDIEKYYSVEHKTTGLFTLLEILKNCTQNKKNRYSDIEERKRMLSAKSASNANRPNDFVKKKREQHLSVWHVCVTYIQDVLQTVSYSKL